MGFEDVIPPPIISCKHCGARTDPRGETLRYCRLCDDLQCRDPGPEEPQQMPRSDIQGISVSRNPYWRNAATDADVGAVLLDVRNMEVDA